ncbi:hypothetical protein [Nonomuraea dietziae]|uniref:hypothetical protein n=1 Tax=Nonomuraea dietziae TaxID=65515 RepID=UPI0031D4FB60
MPYGRVCHRAFGKTYHFVYGQGRPNEYMNRQLDPPRADPCHVDENVYWLCIGLLQTFCGLLVENVGEASLLLEPDDALDNFHHGYLHKVTK